MSQYFIVCNMDKRELLSSYWFGHNQKLPELLRPGDGLMAGLGVLLTLSGTAAYNDGSLYGRWAGDRIAIVGDYYQGTVAGQEFDQDVWCRIATQHDGWVDISEHVRKLLVTEWEMTMPPPLVDGTEPRSILSFGRHRYRCAKLRLGRKSLNWAPG